MFTLAQYVFGVGKPLENNSNNQQQLDNTNNNQVDKSPQLSCFENDNESNLRFLTNIENDWILIEVNGAAGEETSNQQTNNKKSEKQSESKTRKLAHANKQNEAWLVDPPECFKNSKKHEKSSSSSGMVKTSSMENLLIEYPSMSIFDNLFVKKPPTSITNHSNPLNKAEQKKLILSKIQNSVGNKKNGDNNKENTPVTRPKKYKSNRSDEMSHVNVPSSLAHLNNSSNKNALVAVVVENKEKSNKKKNKMLITKKQHQRQNKVSQQRNGPIIRQKKMFTHINGIYHNRNNC